MNHYRDSSGNYLGGFNVPPEGGILVEMMPVRADQKWDGAEWIFPRNYSGELAELNAAYQADIYTLNRAYSVAAMAGGTNQSAKQAAITEQFNTRKAKYVADLNALRAQYGA